MKITNVVLTGAFVAQAAAQIPANFPSCGEVCISNMIARHGELGCSDSKDVRCLCQNLDFSYGIRDCANQACPDFNVAGVVIQFGKDYCASNGFSVNIPTSASTQAPSATGGATGIVPPVPTGVSVTTIITDGSSVVSTISPSTPAASGIASSATAVVSSIASSASAAVSSIVSSATAAIGSASSSVATITSGGTLITTTLAPSSSSSAAASSGASSPGAASSTSRPNAGNPQQTAAPAGLLAVAGIAAFLL